MKNTLSSLARRFEAYRAADIKKDILDTDEMFVPGGEAHYFSVGASAIEVIAKAMVLAGRTSFDTVLDLPCGAGRVTRHLTAFFPDAKLYVAELDKRKEAFVVEKFGGTPFEVDADFSADPKQRFDLVFVGSLLTHLNVAPFMRALQWFIKATADNGLLVVSLHGRRHDVVERTIHRTLPVESWARGAREYARSGFGYVETEVKADSSYGISWSAPSWVMKLLENDARIRVLGFQEAAWDNHHDVLVIQRRPLEP